MEKLVIKKFKYALLLALFCSAQTSAQASIYERFLNIACSLYPVNVILEGATNLKKILLDLKTPINNDKEKSAYPHAIAYVQKQLKATGINPDHIRINNTPTMLGSGSGIRTLVLPLSSLENPDPRAAREANQARGITAHEFGHLKRHSMIKDLAARALILAGTEICAQRFSLLHNKFLGMLFKTVFSQTLLTTFKHYDEYSADGMVIEQFKNDQHTLLSLAIFYLKLQQSEAKKFVTNEQETDKIKAEIAFRCNPVVETYIHWFFDDHASPLARANRLIKAAGLACNQRLLAQIIKRQIIAHISQKNSDADTSNIIHILKNSRYKLIIHFGIDPGPSLADQTKALDAIDIAYPFQTYGL